MVKAHAASTAQNYLRMEQQPLLNIEEGELGAEEVIRSSQENGTTQPCIFIVHEGLRHVNANAYRPMLVSIGPYHRGKPECLAMEEHKKRYLELFLARMKQGKELYLEAMNKLESKARKCYANSVALDKEKFVEMMLLDGCFVIEFLYNSYKGRLGDKDDPIFKESWMQFQIHRDLMLLENQLPFSVLSTLFDMTGTSRDGCLPLLNLAMIPVLNVVPIHDYLPSLYNSHEPKHFLDLVHRVYHPSSSNDKTCTKMQMQMPCVMELHEAGVDFKVEKGKANIFDIDFKCGKLKMPNFTVSDLTEGFFRNMIAYEQHSPEAEPKYFTDFTYFLDKLINSKEDVSKLRSCGIIENMLGDDQKVADMVNGLCDGMFIFRYTYSKLCKKVNDHCDKGCKKAMATLRRNYFTNVWVTASTIAAIILLVLTLTQTVVALMTLHA